MQIHLQLVLSHVFQSVRKLANAHGTLLVSP